MLAEYKKVPETAFTPAVLTDAQKTDRVNFLNEIIAMAAKEMEGKGTIGLYEDKYTPPAE